APSDRRPRGHPPPIGPAPGILCLAGKFPMGIETICEREERETAMTEHDAQRQGASQHRGAGDEGSGQPGGRELARLLHDVADAQVKMAGLIEASRQELRDLVTRCERAAEQISRAAESLALAAGVGG